MADISTFRFVLKWYEPMSGTTRDYVLSYFTPQGSRPNELSIYDMKNKKIFLKKVTYPSITMNDLYVGNIITIYSRQYEVVRYGDNKTKETFESQRGKLVVVLPESLSQDYGTILTEATKENLSISRLKTVNQSLGGVAGSSSMQSSQGSQMWVELIGDQVRDAWARVCDRLPQLREEVPESSVMDPCSEADQIFKSQQTTATFDHCSLCVVKPHAVQSGYVGSILSALNNGGFDIAAIQLFHLTREEAENFLEVYKGVIKNNEYSDLTNEFSSGPVVAIEVRKADGCVQALRELCGPHDVEIAKALRPNTLRSRFGKNNVQNAVHCTDLPEDGMLESQFFFEIMVHAQQ